MSQFVQSPCVFFIFSCTIFDFLIEGLFYVRFPLLPGFLSLEDQLPTGLADVFPVLLVVDGCQCFFCKLCY